MKKNLPFNDNQNIIDQIKNINETIEKDLTKLKQATSDIQTSISQTIFGGSL